MHHRQPSMVGTVRAFVCMRATTDIQVHVVHAGRRRNTGGGGKPIICFRLLFWPSLLIIPICMDYKPGCSIGVDLM